MTVGCWGASWGPQAAQPTWQAADCELGVLAAVNCATLGADQAAPAMVSSCKAETTAGGESRQAGQTQPLSRTAHTSRRRT